MEEVRDSRLEQEGKGAAAATVKEFAAIQLIEKFAVVVMVMAIAAPAAIALPPDQ